MKKLLIAITALMASLTSFAIGLDVAGGIGNHLGVDVNAGTNGIGFEVSTPVTRWVQARLGVSVMPGFHFTTDVDVDVDTYGYGDPSMDVEASFKRVQGSLIFNVYPFPVGSFYVAAGAYFGGKDLITIKGHSDDYNALNSAGVSIGDYQIPIDADGNVKGGLKVNSFRPYLGIGWGRPVPNRCLNFGVELGVQIHGTPKVYYTENGKDHVVTMKEFGVDSDDTFQKIMDKLNVWPVVKFTLSGKIF